MTTTSEPQETVTKTAFDQVKGERDQYKARIDALEKDARSMLLVDKAYSHLKGKVPDAYGAARTISRDSLFAEVKDEELPARLDAWVEEQKSLFGAPPAAPVESSDTDAPDPAAPIAPPPGAARAAPSPSNTGATPTPPKLTIDSPEIKEALKRGDRAFIEQAIKEGRYESQPGNPYAPR
jgi:hypothetical protein